MMSSASHKKRKSSQVQPADADADDDTRHELRFDHVETEDHCETPLQAYEDIAKALEWVAGRLQKKPKDVLVYDPYYCAGGVRSRLQALGFANVQNSNCDCYKTWECQEYDILVTNPPYSGDHIDRLMTFCLKKKKPFFWCVPLWAHKRSLLQSAWQKPVYISPRKRYIYEPPPNLREKKKSDTHKKTAPFHSIWIIWAGSQHETDLLARFLQTSFRGQGPTSPRLARSRSQLRDLRRSSPPVEPQRKKQKILSSTAPTQAPVEVARVKSSKSHPQKTSEQLPDLEQRHKQKKQRRKKKKKK